MSENIIFFILFIFFVLAVLLLDLLVIGRKSHEVPAREAAIWSAVWITLSLGFALFLRFFAEHIHGIEDFEDLTRIVNKYSPYMALDASSFEKSLDIFRIHTAISYLSGYLIEWSLSVDNLFVIMAILAAFSVKKSAYKKVLFWGIMGAIVMRCIFIFGGEALMLQAEHVNPEQVACRRTVVGR